jgi:hypothetical protein
MKMVLQIAVRDIGQLTDLLPDGAEELAQLMDQVVTAVGALLAELDRQG